jgi:hypothetical protein
MDQLATIKTYVHTVMQPPKPHMILFWQLQQQFLNPGQIPVDSINSG